MNALPTIHPGEFLSELLDDLAMSQVALARTIGVSPMRISHVIKGSRPISADLAHLFGKVFGQTPQYWMNLQMDFDLKTAVPHVQKQLAHIVPLIDAGTPSTSNVPPIKHALNTH